MAPGALFPALRSEVVSIIVGWEGLTVLPAWIARDEVHRLAWNYDPRHFTAFVAGPRIVWIRFEKLVFRQLDLTSIWHEALLQEVMIGCTPIMA